MRTVLALLRKEFLQIFRNKLMLRIILIVPMMQLLILPLAATFEVKNLSLSVVDNDNSTTSRKLVSKLQSSGYFILQSVPSSYKEAMKDLDADKTDILIEFPAGFERSIYRGENPRLSITVNAINSMKAGLAGGYVSGIVTDFGKELAEEMPMPPTATASPRFDTTYSSWFNPQLSYKTLIVPGILVILVTIISLILSSTNIVLEKEIGTIEQLNVTPITKPQFIAGKLLPFWIIGMVQLSIGLGLARLIYHIPIEGNLLVVYSFAAIYLVALLSLGFIFSSISQNQVQSMFIALFFTLNFILLSGLFTPVESMPDWAQTLNKLNPVAYFVDLNRLVLLKGSGFADLRNHFIAISAIAASLLSLAVVSYKKEQS